MTLLENYHERKKEVDAYLDFLKQIERREDVEHPVTVQPTQRQILYANVYLLLYNLIESTITSCGKELNDIFADFTVARIHDLTDEIRCHWYRQISNYTKSSNEERWRGIETLCNKLLDAKSKLEIQFDFVSAGNLDSRNIESILQKYGINITEMPKELTTRVKKHRFNNMGAIQSVKHFRNELAHGEKSFAECGERNYSDLQEIADIVFDYLEFIISRVENFITDEKYLMPKAVS